MDRNPHDIIQRVDFYLNGALAQSITQAPFNYSATGLAYGAYILTAVATDSQGAQTTSSARTFTVSNTNVPPTVSLVTPTDSSRWNAPASVTFQASVSSGEANDTVSVEFFANGVSQGVRSSAPWSVTTTLSAATYTITAVATDGQGASTTSAARTITVSDTNAPPTISISAPSGGANYPTAPASFTLNATANAGEVNGWVTKVEFYVNGALVNTDTAAPWSYNVSGLANGSYTLTAKAFDQLNAATTSAPVAITVGPQPKLHFVQVDHLNTPRLVANDQGQTVWRWDQQEPFGVNVPDENPGGLGAFDLPLRLPGQYFDKETNLHYNYFRDYDASIGRYPESDPIGLRGGLNTYAYVAMNPLSFSDPRGLDNPQLYGMMKNPSIAPPLPFNPNYGPSADNCAHYPPGLLYDICSGTPSNPNMNCSRKCLQVTYPGSGANALQLGAWIVPIHPICWWECGLTPFSFCPTK
jgi:RHS repeat-associated protein